MTWDFPNEFDVARHRVVVIGEFSFLLGAPVRPLGGFALVEHVLRALFERACFVAWAVARYA